MEWAMSLEGNDFISVGQGGGKSLIIAGFVDRIKKPILVICPTKEILQQDVEKMLSYVDKEKIGIFSASMDEKTIKDITFGTIQSMYRKPELFTNFDIVIYDEADLHNAKNFDGMSNRFFEEAGIKKVFGFSGTPFRLGANYRRWGQLRWQVSTIQTTKIITRTRPLFWHRMLEVVNVKDLQEQGYLTKLTYKDVSLVEHEDIPTNKSQTEFDLEKFENSVFNHYTDTAKFIDDLPHKKKLIFSSSVTQAETLQGLIPDSVVVSATTPKKEREKAIQDFRSGVIKTLLGVNIFTVGFDVPDIDCIVVLRPTKSLRLWTQVLGRGTRLAEGKTTCTVYDFVGNIKALGTLESMEIKKIEGLWNVVTDAKPLGFHGVALFEYKLKDPNLRRFTARRELLV